ncbi:hypothetical protein BC940DRAFT_302653 [Gongronella butleri]|nr:hypothetical protein BC940DRAFT_302653 [Gongronella butleri]
MHKSIEKKNTPPPDADISKVEPFPSVSMPLLPPHHAPLSPVPPPPPTRHRRHTITRPDSALGFLSDSDDGDDGENESRALDRMSDMLANLIQEANAAVTRPVRQKKKKIPASAPFSASTSTLAAYAARKTPMQPTNRTITPSRSLSRMRPRSMQAPKQQANASSASSASASTPSSSSSPALFSPKDEKSPLSSDDPLMESFRRLDSSMAVVDSLARDLASSSDHHEHEPMERKAGLAAPLPLLLLPLLHIPHALITTVFDTLNLPASTVSASPATSESLTGMMAWAFFFTLANVIITWSPRGHPTLAPASPTASASVPTTTSTSLVMLSSRARRLSLPGSYHHALESNENVIDDDPLPAASHDNNVNHVNHVYPTPAGNMQRARRPAPINTSLSLSRKPVSSTSYTRRHTRRVVPSRKRVALPSRAPMHPPALQTPATPTPTCKRRHSM